MKSNIAIVIIFLIIIGAMLKHGFNYQTFVIEQMDLNEDERAALETDCAMQESKIESLEKQIEEDKELVRDVLGKADLIHTLQEAGAVSENITTSELPTVLDMISYMPFGSPFRGGHVVTSPYGKRDESFFNGDGYTDGIDLVGLHGSTEICAPVDGIIVDFGVSETIGKYIIMEHPGGYRTEYAHLKKIYWQDVDTKQVTGIPVKAGSKIGVMGATGSLVYSEYGGDGAHLDYRVSVFTDTGWTYINPSPILEGERSW